MTAPSVSDIRIRVVKAYEKNAPSDHAPGAEPTPLDSLAFMSFIVDLEAEFSLTIPAEDITEEQFANADNISKYLSRRLSG